MNTIPYTDEHKEQAPTKQDAFKLKLKLEREEEQKLLEKREAEEALMRAMKTKKPKKKRVYKKRVKKEVVKEYTPEPLSLSPSPEPILKLPVYLTKIEVNEYNKFKVDYIRAQIYHNKDKKRKEIYENALTKYDMSNYHNLK